MKVFAVFAGEKEVKIERNENVAAESSRYLSPARVISHITPTECEVLPPIGHEGNTFPRPERRAAAGTVPVTGGAGRGVSAG